MPSFTPKERAVMCLRDAGVPVAQIACRLQVKRSQVEEILSTRATMTRGVAA